jgi:hypothetical protein
MRRLLFLLPFAMIAASFAQTWRLLEGRHGHLAAKRLMEALPATETTQ